MDKSKFAVSTYNKIADEYTKQYFNELTDTPWIDRFLDCLPKGAKILDIGCGPGTFTGYVANKGYKIKGIDLSSKMINIAREKVPGIDFKVADMRKLSYEGEVFDGLLAAYSLIHIPSKEMVATLKGFYRILQKGGVLLVIAQKGEPDKIVDELLKEGERIFVNFFTKSRLSKFLKKAGFEIKFQEETEMQDSDSLSDRVIYAIAQKPVE